MPAGYVINAQPAAGDPPPPNTGAFRPMTFPGSIPGCPPGLEYMASLDKMIVKQEVSVLEIMTGFEAKNKYRILNSSYQQAYWALEESEFCHRMMCGPERGFTFHITDNNHQEVMRVVREFRCCKACCCWCADGCCMYPIHIYDQQGQMLGYTRQMSSRCSPYLGIFDNDDTLLYTITGPCCFCQGPCCTADINYPITRVKDDAIMGTISKIWCGALREFFTDSETFGVQFPMDLEVKHKALMLGAVFLVDFAIFEKMKNAN